MVVVICSSTEVVDITLQVMIVSRRVNWAVKHIIIHIKRHCSISDVIKINNEQLWLKNRALKESRINRQYVR